MIVDEVVVVAGHSHELAPLDEATHGKVMVLAKLGAVDDPTQQLAPVALADAQQGGGERIGSAQILDRLVHLAVELAIDAGIDHQ